MRDTITRRIITNKVHGYIVNIVDDMPTPQPVEPVTVYGNVDKKDGKKALQEKYGKDVDIFVGKIETEEVQYEIAVEDFVKNAKVVPAKTEETETKNEEKEVI